MPTTHDTTSFRAALNHLEEALTMLEMVVETKLASSAGSGDHGEELQRMNADRSRLALALDESEARAERLENASHDVSRRLIIAMEKIRSVVEL